MITLEAVQSATERHAAYEERAVRMQQVAEQRPDNERIEFRKTGVIE